MDDGAVFGDRLAGIPAGPELAAVLASIDPTTVPNGSTVEFLRACARQRAHTDGLYLAAMASTLERNSSAGADSGAVLAEPDRFAPDEIRAALVKTRRAGLFESEFAYDLCRGLPTVHAQMLAGRLDWDRAWVFTQHLAGLPAGLVTRVLDALLAQAPSLTTGQLRARILKLILTADPDRAQDTYEQALAGRAVVGYLNPDGTAAITATGLPPDEAAAATERIAQLARAAKRAGHPGLVDQWRADIYLRLLDGRFHHLTRAEMITALLAETPPAARSQAVPAETPPAEATATEHLARPEPDSPEPDTAESHGVEPDSAEQPGVEPNCAEPNCAEPNCAEPNCAEPNCAEAHTAESEESCPDDLELAAASRQATSENTTRGRVVGVEVRARLDSLAGVNELPGELSGWGPITAEATRRAVARQHHGQWRWAVTDHDGYLITEGLTRRRPGTGPPTHHADGGIVELAIPATVLARLAKHPPPQWAGVIGDIATQHAHARAGPNTRPDDQSRRRFPGRALRRCIQIRDRTCTAPGCRRPATQSEQDHTRDHQHGGATTSANLGPGCGHDHQLKHEGGWTVTQPRPGHFIWTSPLGQRYHTRGERITDPQPEPEPPPF